MLAASFEALIVDALLPEIDLNEILFSVISFAIIFAVLSVILYLAGNIVVGKTKAKIKDAFAISVLGTLVLIVCLSVFSLGVATVLSLIAWLLLVRHYYETGLLRSFAVGVTSVIVAVAILYFLSVLLGVSLLFSLMPVVVV